LGTFRERSLFENSYRREEEEKIKVGILQEKDGLGQTSGI
jgi:hypothetical protein